MIALDIVADQPTYIEYAPGGPIHGLKIIPPQPEDIEFINSRCADGLKHLMTEVIHDERDIDFARIGRFLNKYGLEMNPSIAISAREERKLYYITGEPYHGPTFGGFDLDTGLAYATRNPFYEKEYGVGFTESIIVHEQGHVNSSKGIVAYTKKDGDIEEVLLRRGFVVQVKGIEGDPEVNHGFYFEEGFADLLSNRYVTDALNKPFGFLESEDALYTDWAKPGVLLPLSFAHRESNGEINFSIPAMAAYGMELIIAKDPEILDIMLISRTSVDGLREFARRIESLSPGLYRFLAALPYTAEGFTEGTQAIIRELYDNDPQKAVDAMHPDRQLTH